MFIKLEVKKATCVDLTMQENIMYIFYCGTKNGQISNKIIHSMCVMTRSIKLLVTLFRKTI